MFRVLECSARVSNVSRTGQETVLDYYGPGAWFGEVSAIDGLPRVHDARAHESATVLHLTTSDLDDLMILHPVLSRALLRLQALRLRLLLVALETYSAQSMEQRLANRLLMLAISFGVATTKGLKIKLHLPQETLAQLIGATRQGVNQILKKWEAEGTIGQRYGRILLLDQARLEKLAQD
ncbi:cAMP-binding domain of CRP or a regulatory subunit of cAMP-dependent protein kinases [Methylocapsa palsarum]|uniref:cAMP-binding domain of CRP or a regulatory subunit of cAMP-dependent protein kinases n=2 Tax=Methylocapsa palsarum TaxID=1612308 RepID=A0A1I3Z1I7_9HYPH|nr:cAMP-binding domain of CRP or a regulatory subunit of cAMP-dependent protein kinases [Methylocapsa palsarum]